MLAAMTAAPLRGFLVITANMQLETGFPSSHQLKSYVASKSRLKLAARAVLSADAGLLVLTSSVCSSAACYALKQILKGCENVQNFCADVGRLEDWTRLNVPMPSNVLLKANRVSAL